MSDDPQVATDRLVVSGGATIGPIDLGFMFLAAVIGIVCVILAFDLMAIFTPLRVFMLAIAFEWLILRACHLKVSFRDNRISCWLIGPVAAAIFLSGHLAPHYAGGQDQGYYTAMAEMMARGEPVAFFDQFDASLPADLSRLYKEQSLWSLGWIKDGRSYLEFYPLHPAMMALATQLLGPGKHTVWLLAAFIGVVVGLYILTYELSAGDRRSGLLAAALAAVCPAFVFFTKFPVSEMTAAALILPAGYHLLQGYRSASVTAMTFHGIASLLLMSGLFLARMSFPIIATSLLTLLFIVLFVLRTDYRKKSFFCAIIVAIFLLYAASLVFYRIKQPDLFFEMISNNYLPSIWRGRWLLMGAGIVGLAVLIALALPVLRARTVTLLRRMVEFAGHWVLPFPGVVTAVLSIPSIYALVGTGNFAPFPVSLPPGLELVRFHSLYALALFMSPFHFVLIIVGRPAYTSKRNIAESLPALFLAMGWPVMLTFAAALPYLYYFGRYLIEILPFAIMTVALSARSSLLPARVVHILVVLGFAWMLAFSLVQVNVTEGEVGRPFHRIAERMKVGDVLAVDGKEITEGTRSLLVTPLRYALGLPTFIVPSGNETQVYGIISRLRAVTAGTLYLLSTTELALTPFGRDNGLRTIDHIRLRAERLRVDNNSRVERWLLPLRRFRLTLVELFLSEIPRSMPLVYTVGDTISMGRDGSGFAYKAYLGKGWSEQEEQDFRWSVGSQASLVLQLIGRPQADSAPLRFTILASTFMGQHVELVINGKHVGDRVINEAPEQMEFSIPPSVVDNDHVEIVFQTPESKSPASLGMSADDRVLGLALRWFRLSS